MPWSNMFLFSRVFLLFVAQYLLQAPIFHYLNQVIVKKSEWEQQKDKNTFFSQESLSLPATVCFSAPMV